MTRADPSSLFGPTTWLQLQLTDTQKEAVRLATPRFASWSGEAPGSSYGGKPFVEHRGRPAFAELAILWTLDEAGWPGVWITHAGGAEKHRRGFWGEQQPFEVPSDVLRLLADVRATRGDTSRGTWDIVCWPADQLSVRIDEMRFVESKWGGKDRIKPDQIAWYRAIREAGAPRDSFLVVEWRLGVPHAAPG
jgi:hypothetical protein